MATRGRDREDRFDTRKLAKVGWAAVFAKHSDPAVHDALVPLLELRRSQAGDFFRIYRVPSEVPVDTSWCPYFLLLVGDPEAIPVSFETQLASRCAVGRIAFDRLADYASYASSVVRADRQVFDSHPSGSAPWPSAGLYSGDPVLGIAASDHSTRSVSVKGPFGCGGGREFDFHYGQGPRVPWIEDKENHQPFDELRRGGSDTHVYAGNAELEVAPGPDEVAFAAYPPRALEPGVARKLLVYLHLEAALGQVEEDAAGRHGAAALDFRRSEAKSRARLAEGTEILLVPQGEGLAFEPPEASLLWSPPWQRTKFEVAATGENLGHVAEASLGCYVGPLLVAEIRLPIVLLAPGEAESAAGEQPDPAVAKPYQAIFASYSHDDTALVKAMETAYQALGMDYLRDVMTLKAGQNWSEELLAMIDKADIFQLFWSEQASKSPYVEQEWRRALRLHRQKGGAFIRPIWWQQPMPKVPRELSRIHFAPVELSPLGALIPAAAPARPEAAKGRNVKTFAGGELVAWTFITPEGDLENRLVAAGAEAKDLALHEVSVRAALSPLR